MPLDIDVLTENILSALQSEVSSNIVVKNRSTRTQALEDGSTSISVTEEVGPAEVNIDSIRPMIKAIATGVINHIKENAYVDDTDGSAGGKWRIV
jgi:hypothetical protein